MRVVYVIGVPGAGKSTAVRGALDLVTYGEPVQYDKPVPHLRFTDSAETSAGHRALWELGRRRESFSGTDALHMAVNPEAIRFVTGLQSDPGAPAVLLGEGDRLANRRFLEACGKSLVVVMIDTPPAVAQDRKAARAQALGVAEQDASWWKGRMTKTANLMRWAKESHAEWVSINGTQPPAAIAQQLAHVIRAGALS